MTGSEIGPTAGLMYRLVRDAMSYSGRNAIGPAEILQRRRKWHPEFGKEVYRCWKERLSRDIIVRNVRSLRQYPEIPNFEWPWQKRRASNWYKTALLAAKTEGFLIWLDAKWVIPHHNGPYEVEYDNEHPFRVRAYKLGFVPYEYVEDVLWDGDDYTNLPVITCRNWGKNGPVTNWNYYREEQMFSDSPPGYLEFFTPKELRPFRK